MTRRLPMNGATRRPRRPKQLMLGEQIHFRVDPTLSDKIAARERLFDAGEKALEAAFKKLGRT